MVKSKVSFRGFKEMTWELRLEGEGNSHGKMGEKEHFK